MSSSFAMHAGNNQTVKLVADLHEDTHWVTLTVEGNECHEATFYVSAAEFDRYRRAAEAFNASLAEQAPLTFAAE